MASKIVVNLDTNKENYKLLKCKQNDDLTLEAVIYENGIVKNLNNATILIQAKKADNTYIIQSTNIIKSNNLITATLDKDFTRIAGQTKIEIVLVESSKQNTTFSFDLEVAGSVIKGAIESSNTVTILENLETKIVEANLVKEVTEELIQNGGAATTGQVAEVVSQLEHKSNDLIGRGVNPIISFNADPTGNTDSTEAIKSSFNLNKHIILPPGVFLINNLVVPDGCTISGSGKTLTILKKSANGFMIDLGRQSFIFDCGFEGQSSIYTGQGIIISKGENVVTRKLQGHQRCVRCAFDNMQGYHVEYTQPNTGWMSRITECDFGKTNADASIKWADETTNGANRYIIDCYSDKPIVNVGGCDNGIIAFNTIGGLGGAEEGIIFPLGTTNSSKKIIILGNRFAIANGSIKVRGIDHVFSDNIVAGNFHFENESSSCSFSNTNKITGNFINNKANNNIFGMSGDFTPEWTASTTNPSYGNSQVVGFWRYEGKKISVSVQITFGSTTNFGTGTWRFGLPFVFSEMTGKYFTGSVMTSKGYTGTVYGTPKVGYVTLYNNQTVGTFGALSPITWASGDVLIFDYEYTLIS